MMRYPSELIPFMISMLISSFVYSAPNINNNSGPLEITALKVLPGHQSGVVFAEFSPDGTRAMTTDGSGTVRVWTVATGTENFVLDGNRGSRPFAASFSSDGKHLLTASNVGVTHVWDSITGEELAIFKGHRGRSGIRSAEFSPDGKYVVTASIDTSARIWDMASRSELAVLRGHEGAVRSAAFSPDSTQLVTASQDGTARLWDVESRAELLVNDSHTGGLLSAVFSSDGTRVMTVGADAVRLWDVASGAEITAIHLAFNSAPRFAILSPDNALILTSGSHGVQLWDANSGTEVIEIRGGHTGSVEYAAFSPSGNRIVTASIDKSARLWDARSGAELAVLVGHRDGVGAVSFNSAGTLVLTGVRHGPGNDTAARIWDVSHVPDVAVGVPVPDQIANPETENSSGCSEEGDAEENFERGSAFFEDDLSADNMTEAMNCFELAAEGGSWEAQIVLAAGYTTGFIGPLDFGTDVDRATKWFVRLKEEAPAFAHHIIAESFETGEEVLPQDFEEAIRWHRLAAKGGEFRSHIALSRLYTRGRGVPVDLERAVFWLEVYYISSRNIFGNVGRIDKTIGDSLSQAKVASLKRQASRCASSGYTACGEPE